MRSAVILMAAAAVRGVGAQGCSSTVQLNTASDILTIMKDLNTKVKNCATYGDLKNLGKLYASKTELAKVADSVKQQQKLSNGKPKWYTDGTAHNYAWMEQACEYRGLTMCTYDEVCPGGKGKLPVGGKQSNGDMWSPVRTVDGKPEWVQTGSRSGGTCNPLSTYHGSTGSACSWCNNNANYGHKAVYACCPCPKGKTCKKHIVKWFTDGTNMHYDDMANSCIAKKLELCNYDEICPDGKNHAPSGGQQNANDMWVPINEGTNGGVKREWIQSGRRAGGMCNRLSTYHDSYAQCSWCNTAGYKGAHKVNYGCCPCRGKNGACPKPPVVTWYNDLTAKPYTYAASSCSAKGKRLCKFHEICPEGFNRPPVGGQQNYADMWVPILTNSGGKEWIQAGKRAGGMCNKLSAYHNSESGCSWCNNNNAGGHKRTYGCCAK